MCARSPAPLDLASSILLLLLYHFHIALFYHVLHNIISTIMYICRYFIIINNHNYTYVREYYNRDIVNVQCIIYLYNMYVYLSSTRFFFLLLRLRELLSQSRGSDVSIIICTQQVSTDISTTCKIII